MSFLKKYGVVILGVMIGIVWVAIESGVFSTNDNSRPAPIIFASYERGYEVTAPGNWTRMPEEEADGINLILEAPRGVASFMIFEELKSDYNITSDEYYNALVSMTAYELNELPDDEVQLEDTEAFTINGSEAKGCEFYYTDAGGLNLRFMLHFFETDDAYVRVVSSAKVSEFETYKPIFKEMAESIVVK